MSVVVGSVSKNSFFIINNQLGLWGTRRYELPLLQFEETHQRPHKILLQNLETEQQQMMGASSSSSSSLLFQQRSVGMIMFMVALLTTNTVVYSYVCTTTTTTTRTQPSFFGRISSSHHHQPQQLHCRLSSSSLSLTTTTTSSTLASSTAIGLSNTLDDNMDNEEAATTTTAESPPPPLSSLEKTWRYVKKPLLRIGNKGPSKSHGNSLRELLVHHTVVKVKINTHKMGKSVPNTKTGLQQITKRAIWRRVSCCCLLCPRSVHSHTHSYLYLSLAIYILIYIGTLQEAFGVLQQLAQDAGAERGMELIQHRDIEKTILVGMPGTLKRIAVGDFPPPPPPPRPSLEDKAMLSDDEEEEEEAKPRRKRSTNPKKRKKPKKLHP